MLTIKSKKKNNQRYLRVALIAAAVLILAGGVTAGYFYFINHWSVGGPGYAPGFNTNRQRGLVGDITPTSSGEKNMNKQIIRKPAVAGSFYPADKNGLQKMVENFLEKAPDPKATLANVAFDGGDQLNLQAIIVPHAGYEYSGQVAAYAFRQIDPADFDRVIILGPSHHFPVQGIFGGGADQWETPLGLLKVWKSSDIPINDEVHAPEHAIEVELPFLQVVFASAGGDSNSDKAGDPSAPSKATLANVAFGVARDDTKLEILPIVVGTMNKEQIDQLVAWLKPQVVNDRALLVVSVDLSHYHSYDEAKKLDEKSVNTILALDRDGVGELEIDAPYAIKALVQLAADLGWESKLLQYKNSGDVTGDKSRVVGYGAIGFYGDAPKATLANVAFDADEQYTAEEKQELLKIARTTLEMHYESGKTYEPKTQNQKFLAKRGVFVTLTKQGQLRGCIGYIEPIKPLIEAVRDNALSAALEDHRFLPVEEDELKEIEIEISILTVPEATNLDEIRPDIDGVILRQGNKGATYLPQVWEDIPDRQTFFSSLCQKAGLSSGCWQNKTTEFFKYQAVVFGE